MWRSERLTAGDLQLALVQWRDHYFKPLHTRGNSLMKAVLQQIENQRNGEDIDTGLIKKVVDSMAALGSEDVDPTSTTATSARLNLDVYRSTFQDDFLRSTESYYRTETEDFLANNSVSDYLKKAEQRLEEEDNRVDRYLHSSTKRPVSEAFSDWGECIKLTSPPACRTLRASSHCRQKADFGRRVSGIVGCGQEGRCVAGGYSSAPSIWC